MNSLIKRLKENNVRFYDFKNIDVGDFLGEGGFSSVYKCTIKGKLYAAKRLYFEFDDSFNEFKSNLFKEFMLSKQLIILSLGLEPSKKFLNIIKKQVNKVLEMNYLR